MLAKELIVVLTIYCVIDVSRKYALVKPSSDKVLNGFIGILNVNQINYELIKEEFYNKLIPKWLETNNVSMHSTYDEGNSVVAEWFI